MTFDVSDVRIENVSRLTFAFYLLTFLSIASASIFIIILINSLTHFLIFCLVVYLGDEELILSNEYEDQWVTCNNSFFHSLCVQGNEIGF